MALNVASSSGCERSTPFTSAARLAPVGLTDIRVEIGRSIVFSFVLTGNLVAHEAKSANLSFQNVARLHEFGRRARMADASRRAAADDIARLECQSGRQL